MVKKSANTILNTNYTQVMQIFLTCTCFMKVNEGKQRVKINVDIRVHRRQKLITNSKNKAERKKRDLLKYLINCGNGLYGAWVKGNMANSYKGRRWGGGGV